MGKFEIESIRRKEIDFKDEGLTKFSDHTNYENRKKVSKIKTHTLNAGESHQE